MKKGGGGRQNWHPRGMPFAHSCIRAQGRQQKHSEGRKNTEDTVLKKMFQRVLSRVVYRVGIFRSVSVGISRYLPYRYRRKTRSVFLVSKNWREPLKKLAGAPFFPRRGGLGPLFVHFALLLKKKRNSRGIIQKKSSRKILKKVFPPKLTVQQYRPKIPIPAVSDTG